MSKGKKVIFIDRDGVINKDPGGWTEHNYVTRWEDFKFLPNSIEAIKALTDNGYEIVLVSNQAGVNKGYYSRAELDEVNSRMLSKIKSSGGRIAKTYYCVHQDSDNCDCRKPKTGLLKKAEKELKVSARDAFFIGDARVDVEAAKRARMKAVLVLSGKTDLEDVAEWETKPDHIFKDLLEAVNFILKGEPK